MYRRDFLASMLAAAVAPAFVPTSQLMRIKPIVVPPEIPVAPRPMGNIAFYDASGRLLAAVPMVVSKAHGGELFLKHPGVTDCGYVVATGTAAEMRYIRPDGAVVFSDNHIPLNTKSLCRGSTIHFPGGTVISLSDGDASLNYTPDVRNAMLDSLWQS